MIIPKEKYGKLLNKSVLLDEEKILKLKKIKKETSFPARIILQPFLEKVLNKYENQTNIKTIPHKFTKRKVTTISIAENLYKRLLKLNDKLNFFLYIFIEEAIDRAENYYLKDDKRN